MTAQLDNEPVYGPGVSVAVDLPLEYRPVEFDFVRFAERLATDFPELSQADWERSTVHISHKLPEGIGGMSTHIGALRRLRQPELIHWLLWLSRHRSMVEFDAINALGPDKDVVVLVSPDQSQNNEPPTIYENNPSVVLAHEIEHASRQLQEPSESPITEQVMKQFRKVNLALGILGTGMVVSIGSAAAAPEQYAGVGFSSGLALMVGSLLLTRSGTKSLSKLHEVGYGSLEEGMFLSEAKAHTYAFHRGRQWHDILRVGRQLQE